MARILLTTLGSLGDLHPVLALALELRRRGHRAEIATSAFYREKIAALGLPFHPLRPDLAITDPALVRRIMDGSRGSERLLRDLLFPAVREIYEDLAPAAAGADLLVSSEIIYAAPILAAKTGLPWVSFSLAPISLRSTIRRDCRCPAAAVGSNPSAPGQIACSRRSPCA
jgi:UDP:flavonoid glycosyltransferase YjiC (YdhE family)